MPRDACLSDPILLAVLVAANLAIFLAYMAIPAAFVWVAVRTRRVPFPGLWLLFGGFIAACGGAHLVAALVFFRPAWYLEAVACVLTAVASSVTAVFLWTCRRAILDAILDYHDLAKEMERLRTWTPPES